MSSKIEEILKSRTEEQIEHDNWLRENISLQKSERVEFTDFDMKRVLEQLRSRDVKEETINAVENIYKNISKLDPASEAEMKNLMGNYFEGQTKVYQLNASSAYENLDKVVNSFERAYLNKAYTLLPENEKEGIRNRLQKNITLEKEDAEKTAKEKISSLNKKFFEADKNKRGQNILSMQKQIEKSLHLCGAAVKETGEIFRINNHLTKDIIEIRPANTKEGYCLFVNGVHQSISSTAANIEKGKGFVISDASQDIKKVAKEGVKIATESIICPPKAAGEMLKRAEKKAVQIIEKVAEKGIEKGKVAAEQGAKAESKER